MECRHQFYRRIEGKLVCSQCGEPSPRRDIFAPLTSVIEDKSLGKIEDKALTYPPQTKRIKRKRGRR